MFKKFGGEHIEDIGLYTKKYLEENPDVKLYIGTDSIQLRYSTLYATALCFWHSGNGVHVVFSRTKTLKVKDLYTRLWAEVEMSLELANQLKNNHQIEATVDLDINSNKKYKSFIAHDAAVGMIKGYGFVVRTKPDAWAASAAADLLCKG